MGGDRRRGHHRPSIGYLLFDGMSQNDDTHLYLRVVLDDQDRMIKALLVDEG
jgi:hypothetical protein